MKPTRIQIKGPMHTSNGGGRTSAYKLDHCENPQFERTLKVHVRLLSLQYIHLRFLSVCETVINVTQC